MRRQGVSNTGQVCPKHVLDPRTFTLQKCVAVPRRARIQGSYTFVPLNFWLESKKEEKSKTRQGVSSTGEGVPAKWGKSPGRDAKAGCV